MPEIVHDRLTEALNYDEVTGWFTWRTKIAKSIRIGRRAGSVDSNGFRFVRIDGKDFLAQRLAWFYVKGEWPVKKLRHRDGDRDNNALDNLAEVSGSGKFPSQFDFQTAAGRQAYGRAHRAENPDLYRSKYLKRDFGIDLAEYQRMFVAQDGVCAICRQPEVAERNGRAKWLAVDHSHITGVVRGLCCSNCNPMLGFAKDSAAILRAAADYLDAYAALDNVVPLKKEAC